jgi:hypothetical protein
VGIHFAASQQGETLLLDLQSEEEANYLRTKKRKNIMLPRTVAQGAF